MGTTGPAPRLILDFEGRARYSPNGQGAVFWNGEDEPLTLEKSPTRTHILETKSLPVLDMALQWIRSGKHPWKTLTMDSIMELKYLVKQGSHPGAAIPARHEWGPINSIYEDKLRQMRDVTDDPANPINCVVFITGAQYDIESQRIKPILKGAIGDLIPYWLDLSTYQESILLKGAKEPIRKVWLRQREENDLEVGDGTNRIVTALGSPVTDPTVEIFYNALQTGKEE